MPASTATLSETNKKEFSPKLEVFYDGGCPLCFHEIEMLKRWDRRQQIVFTDIDAPSFVAADYGKSQAQLMAHMHARLPEGQWVEGVEVFRRMYTIVGFGLPVWLSRLPGLAHLLEILYAVFARVRLKLPRRRCSTDRCRVK